jgi:universal stress protein E
MNGMVEGRIFSRILVGTDGSARAQVAVDQAVGLASISDSLLGVVFVIDTGRPHDVPAGPIAEDAIAKAHASAGAAGLELDGRILAGDPSASLLQEVEEKRVDLLCVGPDSGLIGAPPRIGRVTKRVLRDAACSVLVARATDGPFPTEIMCGVDTSAGSGELAAFAASIAAAAHADLAIVHATSLIQRRSAADVVRERLAAPEIEGTMRAAEASGISIALKIIRGRPERRLLKETKRRATDLLIVGHRGVSGVHRALLGSVSERCAHNASCSVLVARSGGRSVGDNQAVAPAT